MKKSARYSGWILWLRKIFYCLFLVRFNIIILVAGWLLLQVDQGQDALISYAARDTWLHAGFWFFFMVFYWALSIWFFARTMFRFRFPTTPVRTAEEIRKSGVDDCASFEISRDDSVYLAMKRYLPRFLGVVAFLAVAHALWSALDVVDTELVGRFRIWLGIALVLIVPFFLIVNYRRKMANALSRSIVQKRPEMADSKVVRNLQSEDVAEEPLYNNMADLIASPWGLFVTIAAGIGLITFIASTLDAVAVGTFMSAILLFFLWAGSWLPVGTLITYIGNMRGIPMITLLLVAAVVFSQWNDNHEIRTLGELPERPTVDTALEAWRDHETNREGRQLVLVATAGGGIRAAYWTATVLGGLQCKVQEFDDRLFAISGVSGGSVGATVYRAVLADGVDSGSVRQKSLQVLSGEFLGPAVAGLLYPDLAQRFLWNVGLPDRGVALEKGWEHAYAGVMKSDTFGQSLLAPYATRPWPALLLNATRVETGRRSVASNLRLVSTRNTESFAVIDDQLRDIGRDLPLSAAAHNSARFPGVSPAGHWKNEDGDIAGRLVDGGYFENFGAEGVLDLLGSIDWFSDQWRDIEPVVIAISSDPGLEEPFTQAPAATAGKFAHEIVSPINSLLSARTAHGIEALERLERRTVALGGTFYHLRMCPPETAPESGKTHNPPLGWALSRVARERIEGYLDESCNSATWQSLLEKLPATPQASCAATDPR